MIVTSLLYYALNMYIAVERTEHRQLARASVIAFFFWGLTANSEGVVSEASGGSETGAGSLTIEPSTCKPS